MELHEAMGPSMKNEHILTVYPDLSKCLRRMLKPTKLSLTQAASGIPHDVRR